MVSISLSLLAASEALSALLTGEVDWPGRGRTHVAWSNHPAFFVAAAVGWFVIALTMANLSLRGAKRLRRMTSLRGSSRI